MPEQGKLKVAYLAPEIPALSATFVYNEILALQKMNVFVLPVSVLQPMHLANEAAVRALSETVTYLYKTPKIKVLKDHLKLLLTQPRSYFSAARLLFSDMVKHHGVSRAALGLAYRFYFAGRLAVTLQKHTIAHLHIHFAHTPTDIGMYASKMTGIPFSVMTHANDLFERGYLLKEKVERSAFFATISNYNLRFLQDLGADTTKLQLIRCGVDAAWQPPVKMRAKNTVFTFGCVGRLVEKKGIDTLLNAAALLKAQQVNFKIKIAGSGPLQNFLMQQAAKLNLTADEVVFVGALSHDEVADFITLLDAFVLPCKRDQQGDMDGIPVVLMEAMLCGVPVISTQLSGIPELVKHQQTGLIVPPDDAQLLAAAMTAMIEQVEQRYLMLEQAKAWVMQHFLLEKNTHKLKNLFLTTHNHPEAVS